MKQPRLVIKRALWGMTEGEGLNDLQPFYQIICIRFGDRYFGGANKNLCRLKPVEIPEIDSVGFVCAEEKIAVQFFEEGGQGGADQFFFVGQV